MILFGPKLKFWIPKLFKKPKVAWKMIVTTTSTLMFTTTSTLMFTSYKYFLLILTKIYVAMLIWSVIVSSYFHSKFHSSEKLFFQREHHICSFSWRFFFFWFIIIENLQNLYQAKYSAQESVRKVSLFNFLYLFSVLSFLQ